MLSSVHDALDHRIFHKECRSLVRAGYNVSVIAQHSRVEVVEGVRIVPLARPAGRISRIIRTGWQIYRKALAEKADLYHFHDPELIGVGILLRCHGKKVIYDVHEDVPQDLLHKFYLPKWMRRPISCLAGSMELLTARLLSAIVVVTPAIAKRFEGHSNDVVLVRNFPVPEEFPAYSPIAWEQRDPAVIFLGSMSRNRGLYEVVKAIELLPNHLNVKLRLLGRFSMPELSAELANQPGWTRVENLGFMQDRKSVSANLNKVRAGLVTIHPIPQLMVSYPVKMFEYMASGIPIIASDFPLWRQFIDESRCGLLVNPLEPREIANAIDYIFTHPREAEEMGTNGRRTMETRFNWTQEELALLRLYNKLCSVVPQKGQPAAPARVAHY
jgi:glycosyltransferase involved in cell wall biosynthesis